MRLPWGKLSDFIGLLPETKISVLGCISFESRSIVAPMYVKGLNKKLARMHLVKISPILNTYPNFSSIVRDATQKNENTLFDSHVPFTAIDARLLDPEHRLITILDNFLDAARDTTILLDITSFPKRFFCFFLRQLLTLTAVENVIVTYTDAGHYGYAKDNLAYTPLPRDYLPGFPFADDDRAQALVASVGYEALGLHLILDEYGDTTEVSDGDSAVSRPRFILSFSSDAQATRRQWATLRSLRPRRAVEGLKRNTEVVAAWDAEQVFRLLEKWSDDSVQLLLAPFGPKPHTLGMALYASQRDVPMIYSQPTSYNPYYTVGSGVTWAYVVKWNGICCYEQMSKGL